MSKVTTMLNEYRKYGFKQTAFHSVNVLYDMIVQKIGALLFGRMRLRNTIVIESHNDFDCNGGAFYQFLLDNNVNEHYQIVWMLRNRKPQHLPKNVVCTSFFRPSLRKEFYLRTAKFILNDDKFIKKRRKDQICVYCMHGAVNLKDVRGLIVVPDYVDYVLSPSEYYDPILCRNLSLPYPNKKMLHIGFPSDDLLFSGSTDEVSKLSDRQYSKIILWMPTFRSNSAERNDSDDVFPFGIPLIKKSEELDRINEFCREHDCFLIIKIHPMQIKESYRELKDMSHIAILDGDRAKSLGIDNYRLMRSCDALMSDFSSSTYSFLQLNRPVAFDFSDLKHYKISLSEEQMIGFTPGARVYSVEDFLAFMRGVIEEKDMFFEERSDFLDKVFTYRDGGSCRRLAEFLGILASPIPNKEI